MSVSLHVLVVDSNPVDAHLVIRALERAGWEVHARRARSVAELAELDLSAIDVVVCQVELDDGTVRDAVAHLPEASPPFVVVLGPREVLGRDEDWLEEGFDDVVARDALHRLPEAVRRLVDAPALPLRITEPVAPALAQASSDLMLTLDPEGRVLFANERWRARLGLDPEALFGTPIYDIIAFDARRDLERALRDAPRRPVARARLAILDEEGARVPLDATWVARYDRGGLRALDGVLVEPGQRPRAEAGGQLMARYRDLEERARELDDHNRRLRRENRDLSSRFEALDAAWRDLDERLELAGATVDDGMWDWRLDDDRVFYSARWGEVAGTTHAAMIGSPDEWFRRVHEDDLDELDAAIEAHLRGDAPAIDVEFRMIGDDGRPRRLRCRGVARHDASGRPVRVAGSLVPVIVRETSENAAVLDRVAFEHDLRRAVERNELSLRYQPIIDPTTGALRELEALVRWHHPVRGHVSPAAFIPAAETLGLIAPIGEWTLREACRARGAWRKAGLMPDDVRVAVNLSAQQFADPELMKLVSSALEDAELEPTSLTLEVTESTLLEDSEATASTLESFREAGISVSIDDFGTGFSSLSYLHRFPAETLKIDRSFVMAMTEDDRHEAIVRALLALGTSLNMHVVAEGVETRAQLDALRALGCTAIQGFLIARPMRDDDLRSQLPRASWLPSALESGAFPAPTADRVS